METFRLEIQPDMVLRIQGCSGDVEITGHEVAAIKVDAEASFERYVHRDDKNISINGYFGDLTLMVPHQTAVELSGIGGDVKIEDVSNVQLGAIGGDVELEGRCERVQIGNVGGDLQVGEAAQLSVQAVGGDAELGTVGQLLGLGHIGGDLELEWRGAIQDDLRAIVGGDASITLEPHVNFALTAVVGGDLEGSGKEWKIGGGTGTHDLIFGEGGHRLYLTVAGDLEIEGGPPPQRNFGDERGPGWHRHPGMDAFGDELRGLGRELEEMGRNLARELSGLGREIAREVRVAGRETMRGMKDDFGPRVRGPRGPVRFPDREFNFDPEQIERIKREARAAAASGIARAQEAVEQALHQWQQPGGPRRPAPPRGPAAPVPPTPPMEPPVGNVYTGQTIRMDAPAQNEEGAARPAQPVDRDAERLAILRMVHEGRLGPDEAEMLLRGLEERS